MYYEINVALNGKHFFATSSRSITDIATLKCVYATITNKFPEHEGFTVSVTENVVSGKFIDVDDLESRWKIKARF